MEAEMAHVSSFDFNFLGLSFHAAGADAMPLVPVALATMVVLALMLKLKQ
jgi:hypothetical protein